MSRNSRRGIFFELDGVLADSHSTLRRVFENFVASLEREMSDVAFDATIGRPVAMFIAQLKRDWQLPQKLDELIQRYNAMLDAAFLAIAPASNAAATLEAASAQGFKIGVVTANAAARSRRWLSGSGLVRFIDTVVHGDEICLGKPDPEPYLVALARSGCTRELSIAIENSAQGARSALSAGLRIFGLAPKDAAPIEWPEPVRLFSAVDEVVPELNRPRLRRAGVR